MVGTAQIRGGLATLAALSTAAAVHAGPGPTPLYVDAAAPAAGNGSSWSQAYNDLQDALTIARLDPNPSKKYDIRVAQGVYTPDKGTGNRAMTFLVASGMTLTGGYAGMNAADPNLRDPAQFVSVLSGDLSGNDVLPFGNTGENAYTVVTIASLGLRPPNATDVEVSGFTVSGGNGAGVNAPGGIAVGSSQNWQTTIRLCVIKNNQGWRGGGIGANSRLTLSDCIIQSNGARQQGGGLYASQSITIQRSVVEGNFSEISFGGGIAASMINAQDSSFLDNRAYLHGGGVHVGSGSSFTNCSVAGNVADTSFGARGSGGGMYILGNQVALTSCFIAHNTGHSGGGLAVTGTSGTSSLNHCTVVGNFALGYGGALELNGSCTVSNSVLANNTGAGVMTVSTGVLTIQRSLLRGGMAGLFPVPSVVYADSNIDADPMFMDSIGTSTVRTAWRDKNYRLRPGSLAVDAADFLLAPNSTLVDVAGQPRRIDILVTPNTGTGSITYLDLGAYETQPACAADFDGSGQPIIDDLFWFLNLYFAGDALANVDGLGDVTVDDLFTFLNAWFRGC